MSLTNEDRELIIRKELERAHETFEEIEVMRQAGKWNGAANRIYYSVFHAVNALFIFDGLQTVRHKGSHALFSQQYVKTGKLPSDFGRFYNNLQTLREKSDYNCFYDVDEQDVIAGMDKAHLYIDAIEAYINK
jgi:uncharacterized protein (UPF0332 family)